MKMNLNQGLYIFIDDEYDSADDDVIAKKFYSDFSAKNLFCWAYKSTDEVNIQMIKENVSVITMIIMDWAFWDTEKNLNLKISQTAENAAKYNAIKRKGLNKNKKFINKVLEQNVPIVIFTKENNETEIEEALGFEIKDKPLLYLTQKQDDINSLISNWYREIPNLLFWSKIRETLRDATIKFKNDMLTSSPSWIRALWENHCVDNGITDSTKYFDETEILLKNVSLDFSETIISTIFNRIPEINEFCRKEYLEAIKSLDSPSTKADLHKILTKTTFLPMKKTSQQHIKSGDLYSDGTNYYINIRANCDTARETSPYIYLLKGILIDDIEFKKEIGTYGSLRTKVDHIIIPFINDKHLKIEFKNLITAQVGLKNNYIIGKKEIKKTFRIGRILPPYIILLKQRYTQYMIREGVMPIPTTFKI